MLILYPATLLDSCISSSRFFVFVFVFWLYRVFVAARGLFSSCGEWRLLFVVVRGLFTAVASLVVEHGL